MPVLTAVSAADEWTVGLSTGAGRIFNGRGAMSSQPLSRRRGQGDVVNVPVEIEARVVLPRGDAHAETRFRDALAESWKALDQTLTYDVPRAVEVHRLVEPQHRVDHHHVRRAVHMKPRGVRGRHLLLAHRISPPSARRRHRARTSEPER